MFRDANATAREFTRPVITSWRQRDGKCHSSIGSFVVVNDQGWIVTTNHIIDQAMTLYDAVASSREADAKLNEIEKRRSSPPKQRARERKKVLKSLGKNPIDRSSVWWSFEETMLRDITRVEMADLAIGRLEPFDEDWIATYPTFKDPEKDFEMGTSLCKLGFPFHSITPEWNAAEERFKLPDDALPLPLFPMEGLFTRTVQLIPPEGDPEPPFPLLMLETSTPGLRGQSGGPIFDRGGRIWAIQAKTAHLPLGFNPKAPGSSRTRVPQFLNVGLGVHAKTVLALLDSKGVTYQMSED